MLNDILYSIDPNTMLLGLLFVIFFALVNFLLSKTIKARGTSGIISFCIALLAVYGLNRTSLDINGIFAGIGLSDTLIYSVVPILILVGLVFMIWKLKFAKTLTLVGAVLIIATFIPNFIYEKSTVLIVGIILFVLGIILWIRSRRKGNTNTNSGNPPSGSIRPRKGGILWIIFILFFVVAFYGTLKGFALPVVIAGIVLLLVGFIIFLRFV